MPSVLPGCGVFLGFEKIFQSSQVSTIPGVPAHSARSQGEGPALSCTVLQQQSCAAPTGERMEQRSTATGGGKFPFLQKSRCPSVVELCPGQQWDLDLPIVLQTPLNTPGPGPGDHADEEQRLLGLCVPKLRACCSLSPCG